jgi:hypothetical protein
MEVSAYSQSNEEVCMVTLCHYAVCLSESAFFATTPCCCVYVLATFLLFECQKYFIWPC